MSQAFCSALPVACTTIAPPTWEPFARLVLDAAYEATLLAACGAKASGGSGTVLLTRLGGGAFGNDDRWIDEAIERALGRVEPAALDVRLVGTVHPVMRAIADAGRADDRKSQVEAVQATPGAMRHDAHPVVAAFGATVCNP